MRQFLSRILSVDMIKLKAQQPRGFAAPSNRQAQNKTYEINAYAAETVHRKNREEG